MTHMTPAQHYNRAQELLDAVQTIQNSMKGPMAVNQALYVDAVNSMLVLSTAATAHAALAAVNPNTAANALALSRQGTPATSDRDAEETETLRLMARLHALLESTTVKDLDTQQVARVLDMLNSTVPSERTRGRNEARTILGNAARARSDQPDRKDPHQPKTDEYIARLDAKVARDNGYGEKVTEAYRLLHSEDPVERGRGRTAAAVLLGDLS